jgi:hypothetical protein
MFTFCLSAHTIDVRSVFTLVFMSFHFSIKFLFKITNYSFWIQSDSITVVCKSYKSGEENKLTMYSLCPKFSILVVTSVTVAWVLVIVTVACFPALPKYTVMLYVYPLDHIACRLLSQIIYVSLVYTVWKYHLWKAQWLHQLLNIQLGCNI